MSPPLQSTMQKLPFSTAELPLHVESNTDLVDCTQNHNDMAVVANHQAATSVRSICVAKCNTVADELHRNLHTRTLLHDLQCSASNSVCHTFSLPTPNHMTTAPAMASSSIQQQTDKGLKLALENAAWTKSISEIKTALRCCVAVLWLHYGMVQHYGSTGVIELQLQSPGWSSCATINPRR